MMHSTKRLAIGTIIKKHLTCNLEKMQDDGGLLMAFPCTFPTFNFEEIFRKTLVVGLSFTSLGESKFRTSLLFKQVSKLQYYHVEEGDETQRNEGGVLYFYGWLDRYQ